MAKAARHDPSEHTDRKSPAVGIARVGRSNGEKKSVVRRSAISCPAPEDQHTGLILFVQLLAEQAAREALAACERSASQPKNSPVRSKPMKGA
jgi:hypothetical protein